jgi:hypothetical protein
MLHPSLSISLHVPLLGLSLTQANSSLLVMFCAPRKTSPREKKKYLAAAGK